ncbi:lysophospholipid acyltransferase family protein [Radiobacillus sp. PE A8.2]|uniref:lysophospholipid acyltransferase family protein n=1 Tax=Radiobacillus sp. PE A8.2 TaxID=3380349 RepID=UPI00388FEE92
MRSLFIYAYAIIQILGSTFDLKKVRRLPKDISIDERNERTFQTPSRVSRNVIEKAGVNVHVTGQEKVPAGPVLFVGNHQGLFDILVLLGYLGKPLGFIAKHEIKKLPIIPKWMELIHCVFIDRTDRRGAIQVINKGIENLEQGQSMVIFPEGTRSKGQALHPFKSGSLRLGTKAKVPIVPIAIEGTYKIMEQNNGRIKAAEVYVQICDPIYPDQYENIKNTVLAEEIQAAVDTALKNM